VNNSEHDDGEKTKDVISYTFYRNKICTWVISSSKNRNDNMMAIIIILIIISLLRTNVRSLNLQAIQIWIDQDVGQKGKLHFVAGLSVCVFHIWQQTRMEVCETKVGSMTDYTISPRLIIYVNSVLGLFTVWMWGRLPTLRRYLIPPSSWLK
jgi:hypothetical protein